MFDFQLKFYWGLFLRTQLLLVYQSVYASLGLSELMIVYTLLCIMFVKSISIVRFYEISSEDHYIPHLSYALPFNIISLN